MRWRWRNSVAQRSIELAMMASTVANSARRSRWMIWGGQGRGFQPELVANERLHARIEARAFPAPLILPTRIRSRISLSRSIERPNSSYIGALFRPKVVGSAWMPWLQLIIGVNLCSIALGDRFAVQFDQILQKNLAGASSV